MTQYNFVTHNKKSSLLVVSTYPDQGTTHTGGGLASYTQNTLLSLKKAYPHQPIVVLANVIDKPTSYIENGILVVRCWHRNFPAIYFQLIAQILKFNQVNKVLFGFEFAAFGDFWITSFVPVFTGILRALGKNLTTVIHQVVLKLDDLSGHIGIKSGPLLHLYNYLLKLFYQAIIFTSNHVIALEPHLAKRLYQIYPSDKITCMPHALYPQRPANKIAARKRLGLHTTPYYVLAFGYLSHYKGSDLLAQAFQQPLIVNGRQVRLILAGGKSPTQGHKSHYRHFYSNLDKLTTNNQNIITTGFVQTPEIKQYYSAADLCIFPYRNFMSASGPVSLALSYGTPYIVSSKLKHYSPLVTTLTVEGIRSAISTSLANKKSLNSSRGYFHQLVSDRKFSSQAPVLGNLLNLDYAPKAL